MTARLRAPVTVRVAVNGKLLNLRSRGHRDRRWQRLKLNQAGLGKSECLQRTLRKRDRDGDYPIPARRLPGPRAHLHGILK